MIDLPGLILQSRLAQLIYDHDSRGDLHVLAHSLRPVARRVAISESVAAIVDNRQGLETTS